MVDQNVGVLGLLIGVAFVLNGVGVFTPAWIVDTISYQGYSLSFTGGIVPFKTDAYGWFQAASILMYTTFAEFFILSLIYCVVFSKVHEHGYSCHMRRRFYSMAMAAIIIVVFTVTSVILLGVNFSSLNIPLSSVTLGYSAWLCVASAAICVAIFGLCIHIAMRSCH